MYDYTYDKKGNLTRAKITGQDGDSDYWVKEGDGKWRSYEEYRGPGHQKNKPGHLRLNGGDWEINEDGSMYHSSGAVEPVAERPRKR